MRVLIADDNKENRYLLQSILQNSGHEVIVAENGKIALALLNKEPVDLIVSDILMPIMDGFRLCSKCKNDEKLRHIPIILLTANYISAKDEEFAAMLGAERFLVRPIDPEVFQSIVKEIETKSKTPGPTDHQFLDDNTIEFFKMYNERVVEQVERKVEELETDIALRQKAEYFANERTKELRAFYNLTDLIQKENISQEQLLQNFAEVFPESWQYPEITAIRISVGTTQYQSPNFAETEWMLSSPIKINDTLNGLLEVAYLEKRPDIDHGPFMQEEVMLINAIAERLGRILERMMAEQELLKSQAIIKDSEERYHNIFNIGVDSLFIIDQDTGAILEANNMACSTYGYTHEELLLLKNIDMSAEPVQTKQATQIMKEDYIFIPLRYHKKKDGTVFPVEIRASLFSDKNRPVLLINTHDITLRQNSEKALNESEKLIQASFDSAIAGIVMVAKDGSFIKANKKACEIWGYSHDELTAMNFRNLTFPEDHNIGNDLSRKMITGELDSAVFEKRYTRKDGQVIWALVSTAAIRDIQNNFQYFVTYIQDITPSKLFAERINNTLEGTIQTLALVVEAKDPYTSGHQKRVAEIAVAIAEQLGLTPWQIRGLYLASTIHDLGKIQIPSEILSKPGTLTDIEFQLIKCHPEAAYNMLKDIDFPWPIAEIIYQHHERLDGSGYPRQLSVDAILLEAKILNVADVVEAMSSHRPYRAAYPIDMALAEIEKYKGIYYDTSVVEACHSVFKGDAR